RDGSARRIGSGGAAPPRVGSRLPPARARVVALCSRRTYTRGPGGCAPSPDHAPTRSASALLRATRVCAIAARVRGGSAPPRPSLSAASRIHVAFADQYVEDSCCPF